MNFSLINARVVLPDTVLPSSSVLVRDGVIVAIDATGGEADEIDLAGSWLLPGLIDLHCDALEKNIEPRPGVYFPIDFAVAQADRTNAAAGITTAYHGVTFEDADFGRRSPKVAAETVRALHALRDRSLVENRVHCRYELTATDGWDVALDLLESGRFHMVSVMDHTPGQGHVANVADYVRFMAKTFGRQLSLAEAADLLARKEARRAGIPDRVEHLVARCRRLGIPAASHDDEFPDQARHYASLGMTLCEFPLNLTTAHAARAAGMRTILGAPNVLRGGSHMGTLKAVDAVREGAANVLCSDYAPATLLDAVFRLPELTRVSLPDSVRLATLHAAEAAGLADRGAIVPGRRGDLIAVDVVNGRPVVGAVWVAGRCVFRSAYPNGR